MDKYAATIQGANNIQTPTSPLGYFPELAAATRSTFQLPQSQAGAGAFGAQANINDAQAQQSAAAQVQANNDKIKALQELQNPKNYQQIQKSDGGYDYAYNDPITGKSQPINIAQYSQATGKSPDQLLKGSTNSLDIQYVNDFNNLQSLTNALATNDSKTLNTLAVKIFGDPSLGPTDKTNVAAIQKVEQLKGLKPDDLIKAFTSYYPNIYSNLPWNQYGQGNAQIHAPNALPMGGGPSGGAISGGVSFPSYGR